MSFSMGKKCRKWQQQERIIEKMKIFCENVTHRSRFGCKEKSPFSFLKYLRNSE
jgi:hypothetical protein